MTVRYEAHREMGLTHRDFFRGIAPLSQGDPIEIGSDGVRIERPFGTVEIVLGAQGERRIGPIVAIPITPVHFRFHGGVEEDWATFMTEFDRRFQRAGG